MVRSIFVEQPFRFFLLKGDSKKVLTQLPDQSIHCGVTSPPYWEQRDYGVQEQLGREKTPQEYVDRLVDIFKEVKRVLRDDATFWLNIGDSFCKKSIPSLFLKPKDLVGVPWMVAFALRKDGWFLRSDIIWKKLNPMPESTKDRPSKSYEHIFLLSKNNKYFYDAESIKEPQKEISIKRAFSKNNVEKRKDFNNPTYAISGESQDKTYVKMRAKIEDGKAILCNKRDVWEISTSSKDTAHCAVFPEELASLCIKAGTAPDGCCSVCHRQLKRVALTGNRKVDWDFNCKCKNRFIIPSIVLDPFNGSGTTGEACFHLRRNYVGAEISPTYVKQTQSVLRELGQMDSEALSFDELLYKENSNA